MKKTKKMIQQDHAHKTERILLNTILKKSTEHNNRIDWICDGLKP